MSQASWKRGGWVFKRSPSRWRHPFRQSSRQSTHLILPVQARAPWWKNWAKLRTQFAKKDRGDVQCVMWKFFITWRWTPGY